MCLAIACVVCYTTSSFMPSLCQAIVFVVGGGNYIEYLNLQEYAKVCSQTVKVVRQDYSPSLPISLQSLSLPLSSLPFPPYSFFPPPPPPHPFVPLFVSSSLPAHMCIVLPTCVTHTVLSLSCYHCTHMHSIAVTTGKEDCVRQLRSCLS